MDAVIAWIASPEIHVGVLTPSASECDFLWEWGLYRGDQVKMRAAPSQSDCCPYKKGEIGHRDRHA